MRFVFAIPLISLWLMLQAATSNGEKVDGGFSDWGPFSECSKTCGQGRKVRTRNCNNPPPSGGGKLCKGKVQDYEKCTVTSCKDPQVDIYMRSEGCEDPDKTKDTCGIAYIKVNGKDVSKHGRGHNVVVVNGQTGVVLDSKSFDTHGDAAAGRHLRDYLQHLNGNKIVLVCVQDEGSKTMGAAVNALKRLGATDPGLIDYRGSYCLAGYAGWYDRPSWITQKQEKRGQGPTEFEMKIPLRKPVKDALDVFIKSEGCEDPDKTINTCGRCYVQVEGQELSPHGRGHNVVVLDGETGEKLEAKSYDTHGDADAGRRLRNDLDSLSGNKIVLVCVQDEGSKFMATAVKALKRVGAVDRVTIDYRGSFALAGSTRLDMPGWIAQDQQKRGQGPSIVSVRIPLYKPKKVPSVQVFLKSEGCEDPGKTKDTCGIGYIEVDGKDLSPHGRGYNVVILNGATGEMIQAKSYDTFADAAAGGRLRDDLNNFKRNEIVLVSVQDEGSKHMAAAIDALKRMGAVDPVTIGFRDSFVFAGYSGWDKPEWIAQNQQPKGQGPSILSLIIPLMKPKKGPVADVFIRSEGCEDPGKTENTCGRCYIKVDGKDHSLHGRGHNIVVLDGEKGDFREARSFDTHGDANAGNNLRDYLNGIEENEIVLVCVQDEGSKTMSPAVGALKSVGAVDPVIDFRGSFALVGFSGDHKPAWITENKHKRGKGPSLIIMEVPLGHEY